MEKNTRSVQISLSFDLITDLLVPELSKYVIIECKFNTPLSSTLSQLRIRFLVPLRHALILMPIPSIEIINLSFLFIQFFFFSSTVGAGAVFFSLLLAQRLLRSKAETISSSLKKNLDTLPLMIGGTRPTSLPSQYRSN